MKQERPLRRVDVIFYTFIVVFTVVGLFVWKRWSYNHTVYVDLAGLTILVAVAILRTFQCPWQRWLDRRMVWEKKPLQLRHFELCIIGLTFVHLFVLCALLILRLVSAYLPFAMIAWGVLYGLAYALMASQTRAGQWLREDAYRWKLVPVPVATIPPKEYRVED